ncbi:hypothetical protein DsansV1_C08g0086321 [Dioscorea sansibarensis]
MIEESVIAHWSSSMAPKMSQGSSDSPKPSCFGALQQHRTDRVGACSILAHGGRRGKHPPYHPQLHLW